MTDRPQPGRELDARVAVALGWQNCREINGIWMGVHLPVSEYEAKEGEFSSVIPAYSGTWEGMRLVVDWLVAQGVDVIIEIILEARMGWRCILHKLSDIVHDVCKYAPTAPHAVALAMLEWKEGQND
jgi:hypothetical protein